MATDPVEALREPLSQLAAQGFVDDGALAKQIQTLCEGVKGSKKLPEELSQWTQAAAELESMPAIEQKIALARGLRILHRIPKRKASAKEPSSPLGQSPAVLKGIGPKLAERLEERGLETLEDMAWFLPRRYDDVRDLRPLAEVVESAEAGTRITASGEVTRARFYGRGRRRWIEVRMCDPESRKHELVIRWFHANPGMAKRFPPGTRTTLSGKLNRRGGAAELSNPDVLEVVGPNGEMVRKAPPIIPRYPDVPGVPPATMRKTSSAALERVFEHLLDAVPTAVAERQGLVPLADSLRGLHTPPEDISSDAVSALNAGESPWHRRLAFDELFILGLAVAERRHKRRSDVARSYPAEATTKSALLSALPFRPTGAQSRAMEEIAQNLGAETPMNRLLHGDVGSGKTVVALAAAHQVAQTGGQIALMAPTSILAEQHHKSLTKIGDALGLRIALLTAATPRQVRESMLSLLAAGSIDMVVGTHALLAERVIFSQLGLVIIDEQHRFGVAQRVTLRQKGGGDAAPHLLVMTATPIPRTLALTAYGDLDVTALDEMPPGRKPAKTVVLSGKAGRAKVEKKIQKCVATGGRAYVVCPLVEASEDADDARASWADATTTANELAAALPELDIGLVHGRLPVDKRDRVMEAFRAGDIQVLVSTTVIEVGVDVPEATLMVILDAHHFGLSQLHQLRGRVGRGGGACECLLVTKGRKTPEAGQRLEVMASTNNGFTVAEADLEIRGPGEVLGTRQAGLPKLRFGDLRRHGELLAAARQEADAIYEADPKLERPEHEGARRVMELRVGEREIYGAEGG